ncbi:hypothetical protein EK904_007654 [Melospiza melodia maxima]|nr:hypothetical protein EK904_007654 [Melospiza melodia maxima]
MSAAPWPGDTSAGLTAVLVPSRCRGTAVAARSAPEDTVTSSFASFIRAARPEHLSPTVRQRSKRMILDSIGVGLVGSTTRVFDIALRYCRVGTAPQMPLPIPPPLPLPLPLPVPLPLPPPPLPPLGLIPVAAAASTIPTPSDAL